MFKNYQTTKVGQGSSFHPVVAELPWVLFQSLPSRPFSTTLDRRQSGKSRYIVQQRLRPLGPPRCSFTALLTFSAFPIPCSLKASFACYPSFPPVRPHLPLSVLHFQTFATFPFSAFITTTTSSIFTSSLIAIIGQAQFVQLRFVLPWCNGAGYRIV